MPEATIVPMQGEADSDTLRSDNNLRLWRQNETTDPSHTKPVRIGKDMTAIDTYYQIKRATETFGPVGIGWGWIAEDEVVEGPPPLMFAKIKLTVWYIDPDSSDRVQMGPVIAMNQLVTAKGYGDDEAFKKATSDAITKSLSYLGFSADIFMGLYDDAKYVARLKQEQNAKTEQTRARLPETCVKAVESLSKANDVAELGIMWKTIQEDLRKLSPAQLDYMKARFAMRKRQLAPEDEPETERQLDEGAGASG